MVEGRYPNVNDLQHSLISLTFQTPRSAYMLYPYYCLLWGTFAASQYMMIRMVFVSRFKILQVEMAPSFTC